MLLWVPIYILMAWFSANNTKTIAEKTTQRSEKAIMSTEMDQATEALLFYYLFPRHISGITMTS